MKRVQQNGKWSLFCPDSAPGLANAHSEDFETLYEKYEQEGKAIKSIPAQKLWFQILQSQIETGTPYLLFKDAANKKSNQQNLGTIKSSNLCVEIIEYSSPDETAVCNLASINLQAFVTSNKLFDFDSLEQTVKRIVVNLNNVIDRNFYPTESTQRSNLKHRPIGIGIQGLADTFARLEIDYDSVHARKLNKKIAACIYFGAITSSCDLAIKFGKYDSFDGSPTSNGKLQYHLWGLSNKDVGDIYKSESDWQQLCSNVQTHGLRNSLLIAPMPTASTSQILGNTESFEPFTNNIYTRRTLAGEFIQVNKYLVNDLMNLKLWNPELKDLIIANKGSIQNIESIPIEIRRRYKTVWEMSQKVLIDLAADRGPFICQSQSLNLYISDPTFKKLSSMHFYSWKSGLKSGIYYLRSRAAADAQQFTVDPSKSSLNSNQIIKNDETECLACGS